MKTCTNVQCPERFSKCCKAISKVSEHGNWFSCSKCGDQFEGGECKGHEESCLCACHDNVLKKPYGHDRKCCDAMNGNIEKDSPEVSEGEKTSRLTSLKNKILKPLRERDGKMYGYWKAVFEDDFERGYPILWDDECVDAIMRGVKEEISRKIKSGELCLQCGDEKEPGLSDMCGKCFENE